MAMEDQKNDDMDSLFEGMVLFIPQMVDNHDVGSHVDVVPSVSDGNTVVFPSAHSPSSKPLDENLFSDLTVITPSNDEASQREMPSDPSPLMMTCATKTEREAAPTPSILRQSSRKKKRAGLRIGYGRDLQHLDETEPLPHAPESSSSAGNSLSAATTIQAYLDAEEEEKQETLSVSSHAGQSEQVVSCPTVNENECVDGMKDIVNSHPNQMNKDGRLNLTEDKNIASTTAGAEESYTFEKQTKEEEDDTCDSVERKYEQIKAQISEKLREAQEKVSSISAAKKNSRRRRRKAAENVKHASVRYREIEKKLEEACEAEDFEMAECLSESLAAAEKEKELLLNELRDAEAECDAIDSKMQEALESQIAAEEECVSFLQHFSKDAVSNADLALENAEVNASKDTDVWFMSVEAVEAKKLELEIESQLVSEAHSTLNISINHLVASDIKAKEVLHEGKKSLTQELEKLLSLVREKEAEIAENDSEIEAVDKRIAEVASGFKDIQSGIDAQFDKLQFVLSQIESEREALSKKKEEIDNLLFLGRNRGQELRKLAVCSADEANTYQENLELRKALVTSVLKAREEKSRLAKTEERILADVQMLKQEISSARASLQELSSKKSSIQQDSAEMKQRMLFITKRMPELEADKKIAAAARNFKEAARIASEAKSLMAEKENQQIKIEESMQELEKVEEEINEITRKLEEFEELISLKEKEAAVARFQRLRLISVAASSERSVALELGDTEEANVLLLEAEAADSEAKQLQLIHDISDEEYPMEIVSNVNGKQLGELAAGL